MAPRQAAQQPAPTARGFADQDRLSDPAVGRSKKACAKGDGRDTNPAVIFRSKTLSLSWKGHKGSRKTKTNVSVGERRMSDIAKNAVKEPERQEMPD